MTPLISVIIPLYNEEYALPRCFDSVLAQNHEKLEVILIDDGSTDQSPVICDHYAARDERVRVIHQENTGRSGARNAGLDAAMGEFILFVDADDYILPDMAKTLLAGIERSQADLATCGVVNVLVEKGKQDAIEPWRPLPPGLQSSSEFVYDSITDYDMRTSYALVNKLFRRELIERHPWRFSPNLPNGQDVDFVAAYLRDCKQVWNIPETYYMCVYEFSGRGMTERDRYLPRYLWNRLDAMRTVYRTASALLEGKRLRQAEAMLADQMVGGAIRHCRRDATLPYEQIIADLRRLASQPDVHVWLEQYRRSPGKSMAIPFLLKHGWVRPLYYLARRKADKRFGRFYQAETTEKASATSA